MRRVYTDDVAAPLARRRTRAWLLVLGLYALVSIVAPLLHHDFACHLQSRPHCDACTANPVASRIEGGVVLVSRIQPIRLKHPDNVVARHWAERPSSPGRAPPSILLAV